MRRNARENTKRAMSEKSLEVDESRAAGLLTMPLVSSSLLELASMALLPRLHRSMPHEPSHHARKPPAMT